MRRCAAAVVCLFIVLSSASAEPQLRPLPVETALDAQVLGPWQAVALAADHAYVAYVVCNPRQKEAFARAARAAGLVPEVSERWYFGCRLELAETANGKTRRLTEESSHSRAAVWSPDGKRLAYLAGIGAEQRLHVWDRDAGTSRVASQYPTALTGSAVPIWLPDSRRLLTLTPRQKVARAATQLAPPVRPDVAPDASTVRVYRSPAAAQDPSAAQSAPWRLEDGDVSLLLVDSVTGESRIVLAQTPKGNSFNYVLSPDGRYAAYARATRFATPTSQQTLMDVHAVELSTGRHSILARDAPMLFGWGLSWSADSASLAWLTAGVQAPYEVGVHTLSSGVTRTVRYAEAPEDPFTRMLRGMMPIHTNSNGVTAPIWNANGKELYVLDPLQRAMWKVSLEASSSARLLSFPEERVLGVVHHARPFVGAAGSKGALQVFTGHERTKQISLHEIDVTTGSSRKLWGDDAQINGAVASADGKLLAYVRQRADAPPDIWVRDMPAGRPRQITRASADFDAYVFGKSRLIEWTTASGERLQGALILPAGHRPGERHPLVVFAYGGAYRSHNLHQFAGGEGMLMATVDNMQLLATRGYAVLLPDAPGRIGSPMKDYADAILLGVDRAIELGIADPERVGVIGHSNGGYTVMGLIAQSTRFKAAVSRAGFSDYVSLAFAMTADGANYGLNIAEDLQLGGSLWQARERWIDNSPLFAFDRVVAATLIVHGAADFAVPAFAADQSFVALRRLGKIVEYARYADEGHSEDVWSRPNRIDYVTRMLGWFERYLGPDRAR
jgi:dipeptidyl aminopeptidase/acylaminoacyl peptidase